MKNPTKLTAAALAFSAAAVGLWAGGTMVSATIQEAIAVEEAYQYLRAIAPGGVVTDEMEQEAAYLRRCMELWSGRSVSGAYGYRRLATMIASGELHG